MVLPLILGVDCLGRASSSGERRTFLAPCDEALLGPLVNGTSSRFCEEVYFLPAFETGPYPFTRHPPKENSSERSLSAEAGAQAGDGKCFPLDTVLACEAACENVLLVPVSLCPVWRSCHFHGDT